MLSKTTKYAFRVLVAFEGEPEGSLVPGRTLAQRTDLPANYLSKVLLALRNAGLVKAVRGVNGGYALCRPTNQIRLIDAAEIFEGVRAHPSCLLGIHDDCSDDLPCSAHATFRDFRQAYIGFLENTSIADAARVEEPHLRTLAGIDSG